MPLHILLSKANIQLLLSFSEETKTLAIFDGCATHLGCTIVLRGGTLSELDRVQYQLLLLLYIKTV